MRSLGFGSLVLAVCCVLGCERRQGGSAEQNSPRTEEAEPGSEPETSPESEAGASSASEADPDETASSRDGNGSDKSMSATVVIQAEERLSATQGEPDSGVGAGDAGAARDAGMASASGFTSSEPDIAVLEPATEQGNSEPQVIEPVVPEPQANEPGVMEPTPSVMEPAPSVSPEPAVIEPQPIAPEPDATSDGINPAQPRLIPMEQAGSFAASSNYYGFTGSWLCYDDGEVPTSCERDVAPYNNGAMCLSGSTVVDDTYTAWGAGIEVRLLEVNGALHPYDAAAAGISGFSFTLEGDMDGAELLFLIPRTTSSTDTAPEISISAPGEYAIQFADLRVPDWAEDPGKEPDPTAVYKLQWKVDGAKSESNYNFCIRNLAAFE